MDTKLTKLEAQVILQLLQQVEIKTTIGEVVKGFTLNNQVITIINKLQNTMDTEETKTEETAAEQPKQEESSDQASQGSEEQAA